MTIIGNKMSLLFFSLSDRLHLISTILVEAASLLSLLTEVFDIFITAEDSMP